MQPDYCQPTYNLGATIKKKNLGAQAHHLSPQKTNKTKTKTKPNVSHSRTSQEIRVEGSVVYRDSFPPLLTNANLIFFSFTPYGGESIYIYIGPFIVP